MCINNNDMTNIIRGYMLSVCTGQGSPDKYFDRITFLNAISCFKVYFNMKRMLTLDILVV